MTTKFTYKNPVIRGFHPDPSICRANGKYYLVCSSFQYFPGVPLFESTDLINWTLIGHVLDREEQLPLKGADSSGGIYAPTIRYHNGRFYMVTTNVSGIQNFYVWTDDIYGSWSDIIPVEQDGIDPSLYFEGDKTYFMSNHSDENGIASIMQCEINPDTGEKLTESRCIWHGCGGRYLESPHLYKIGLWYYLMAAEGGTEYGHMVVISRGKSPYGPFENSPVSPIVSNRDLGGYPLQGAGHGDLVCDEYGNWWMVLLAFRQMGQYQPYHQLGREVCLIPVTFREDGWVEAGIQGKVRLEMETERCLNAYSQSFQTEYTFENTVMEKEWVFLRNPYMENYRWKRNMLFLKGTKVTLSEENVSPTFLGIRQLEMDGYIQVTVEVAEGEAGLSLYMDNCHHYDFAIRKSNGINTVIKRRCVGDMEYIQQEEALNPNANVVTLKIAVQNQNYQFEIAAPQLSDFGKASAKYLSSEVAGGFTGVMIGLYTVSSSGQWACFSKFSYTPKYK